jgi:type IV pilus assembly protein PilQ
MKNVNLKIIILLLLSFALANCTTTGKFKKPKSVHGDQPLINTQEVVEQGRKDMERIIEAGPKPYDTEIEIREDKRKTITTEEVRNYVSIPSEYSNLKQSVSINFNNIDFTEAMSLMSDIGDVNILVGEEVSGTVSAKIKDVSWDVAFQTLLDMKTLGADYDVRNSIIRVHTPEKLTSQETFKATRADALKKKIELEVSVEPILAEIFRLYYISPAEAKTTLENLFNADGGAEGTSTLKNVTITEENTTRSIIVRGYKPDLDIIDAVIREIDVKTKQVLIEAFIVEANSTFQTALGSRIGGMTKSDRGADQTTISGTIGGAATTSAGVTLGAAAGTLAGNQITNATSGIGILKQMGASALKIEIEALESLGTTKIVSSPSVFTLNNQEAKITQGTEIAYQVTSDGTTTTEFKEAALSLTVTPSIIGDGNVLMDIVVNNDSPTEVAGSDEPAIKTNEITTKLLVSDGDIVVIGGIKINNQSESKTKTPKLGDAPVIGNLFKGKDNSDTLDEMLIFLAPRVID